MSEVVKGADVAVTQEQAAEIVEFLERYNKHFEEVVMFVKQKNQKVLADDLVWLLDSLSEEQRLSMAGNSLEHKRLELFKSMGFDDYNSKELLEIFPEEYQGRFKLECTAIENSIDTIKVINDEIIETIEKKMDVAEEHLKKQGVAGPNFYDTAGGKVRITDPESDIIGEM